MTQADQLIYEQAMELVHAYGFWYCEYTGDFETHEYMSDDDGNEEDLCCVCEHGVDHKNHKWSKEFMHKGSK